MITNSFYSDTNYFIKNNKILCGLTLGLAIAVYCIGNLGSRIVSWIKECSGSSKKTDVIAKQNLTKPSHAINPTSTPHSSSLSSETSVKKTDVIAIQNLTDPSQTTNPKITPHSSSLTSETSLKETDSSHSSWGEDDIDEQVYDKDWNDVDTGESNESQMETRLVNSKKQKDRAYRELTEELAKTSEVYGEAVDNGDCFYDAIAKNIGSTVEKLRNIVADYIEQLEKSGKENWVKKAIDIDVTDTTPYEQYKVNVRRSNSPDVVPIWGRLHIEGKIIAERLNLKIELCTIYAQDTTDDDDGITTVKPGWETVGDKQAQSVRIALVPGHFVPIKKGVLPGQSKTAESS